jgi:hypothetical protein
MGERIRDNFTFSLPIKMVQHIDSERGLITRSAYVTNILAKVYNIKEALSKDSIYLSKEAAAARNNILYQQQVIHQIQKNSNFLVPAWPNVQSRFSNNSIEQRTAENTDPNLEPGATPESNAEPQSESKLEGSSSFQCFYCDESFSDNNERRNHRQQFHSDKPLDYPTPEDFDNRLKR